jgi:uncharacterized protein
LKYEITQGCTLCGTCVYECPQEAITLSKDGAKIDQEKCVRCGICYDNCASEAIAKVEES